MSFLQLAQKRYSVRQFSNKPIDKQSLDLILEAGRVSPTACNNQPQRILVIESSEARAKVKDCTPCHFDAPLTLLVCYDKSVSWKRGYDGDDGGTVDASIVTAQMMLQASELGIGSTWVGYFDPQKIRKAFALPKNYVPIALLPLGYPAADAVPNQRHSEREPLEKTVFYNEFS
jgi:nitroreductase